MYHAFYTFKDAKKRARVGMPPAMALCATVVFMLSILVLVMEGIEQAFLLGGSAIVMIPAFAFVFLWRRRDRAFERMLGTESGRALLAEGDQLQKELNLNNQKSNIVPTSLCEATDTLSRRQYDHLEEIRGAYEAL